MKLIIKKKNPEQNKTKDQNQHLLKRDNLYDKFYVL